MSDKVLRTTQSPPGSGTELRAEITCLILEALNLEVAPSDIDPHAPLYGDGLGLDSIDILEVALVVSKHYGIELRTDGADNERIFRSLQHLTDYVAAHRKK